MISLGSLSINDVACQIHDIAQANAFCDDDSDFTTADHDIALNVAI
jgi:hypothetical protein